jgi:hypothetical protein
MIQSCASASSTNDSHPTQLTLDKTILKQKVKLTSKEKNELKELYAIWVCQEIHPYSIVKDTGFQILAHTVNDLALKYYLDIKNELVEPLKAKAVPICPDFWSNKYNQ